MDTISLLGTNRFFILFLKPGMKHGLDKPDDETVVKKPRTEESLEPERVFLEKNRVSF